MNSAFPPVSGLLLGLFLVMPWPLVRWAALAGLVFLVLSWTWSKLLKLGLHVDGGPSAQRSFSGQKTTIELKIENRSLLPTGLISLFDSAENLECWGETRFFLNLGPRTRRRFSYVVRGRSRGLHRLGPLELAGSDPACLFPFRRAEPFERLLLLYPPVYPVVRGPLSGSPPGTRAFPRLPEDVSRFRSFRDFEEGDEISRLAAAESARRGTLTVKTFDRTASRSVVVFLDFRAESYPLRRRWHWMDRAVETAAAVIWERLGQGENVWLTAAGHLPSWSGSLQETPAGEGGSWGPGRGWAAARFFFEMLALIRAGETSKRIYDDSFWLAALPSPPAKLYWISGEALPSEWPGLGRYEKVELRLGLHQETGDYGEVDLQGL